MPLRVPGAGSSTSVRSWRRALSSLRYCTSSAWQRRHDSTWSSVAWSACPVPSTMWGSALATSSQLIRSDGTGFLLTPHREQLLPELATSPVQAHLGRRLADSQLIRDSLVRQVVDVTQHDDRPQLRRQLTQGGRDLVALQRCVGLELRIVI